MYHRIAELRADPWELTVSLENFESQIKALKNNFSVLPISSLLAQVASKKINKNSVYITFDDGYADNYELAKPILEKYACPATFFIPTHFISKQQSFWWDELENLTLHAPFLPSKLSIDFGDSSGSFDVSGDEVLTYEMQQAHRNWKWNQVPPNKRCMLYLTLSEKLKSLSYNEACQYLEEIKKWANNPYFPTHENTLMSKVQLKALSEHPLFSLGLHTHTHPALVGLSKEDQFNEVVANQQYFEQNKLQTINAIAYPHGSCNEETIEVMQEHQLSAGFTTQEEPVSRDSSPYHLGRYQVKNISGKELNAKLNNWLST